MSRGERLIRDSKFERHIDHKELTLSSIRQEFHILGEKTCTPMGNYNFPISPEDGKGRPIMIEVADESTKNMLLINALIIAYVRRGRHLMTQLLASRVGSTK